MDTPINISQKNPITSFLQVFDRATTSLKELVEEAKTTNTDVVAGVTHSTFLKILVSLVLGEPLVEAATRKIVNGAVTVLDVSKDLKTKN